MDILDIVLSELKRIKELGKEDAYFIKQELELRIIELEAIQRYRSTNNVDLYFQNLEEDYRCSI